MTCRFGRFFLIFASLIFSLVLPAAADTIRIEPPGSPGADAATENILDVIKTMRDGGLAGEADQLEHLLKNGQTYYRTSGPNMYDAQYVHSLNLDDDDSRMYFSVRQVNYVEGQGPQRLEGTARRQQLYNTVLVSLHELTHKDQGRASIIASVNAGNSRGYSLHEIEAYRTALKKFAPIWVIRDLEHYLENRASMSVDQKYEAVAALHSKLSALRGSLGALTGYGDRACRWQAIDAETGKLLDMIDALFIEENSRRQCRNNLDNAAYHGQQAIEIKLKFDKIGEEMKSAKSELDGMAEQYTSDRNKITELRAELENPKTKSARRGELADRIGRLTANLDDLRERHNRLVDEYNKKIAERKNLRARYDEATSRQKAETSGFDQCRIDYVRDMMVNFKLPDAQLPPDMVRQPDGSIAVLPNGERRPVDFTGIPDELRKMFDYDTTLLNAAEVALADDPRTPCYKPQNTATAPAQQQTKPKKKCSGGGLVSAMNCVADRIEQGQ